MPLECASGVVKLPAPAPRQGNATHRKHVPGSPGSARTRRVGREGAELRGPEHAGQARGERGRGAGGGGSAQISLSSLTCPSCPPRSRGLQSGGWRQFLKTFWAFATKKCALAVFSGSLSILRCIVCISHTFWSPVEGGNPSADLLLILRPKAVSCPE